jgi:hypothetical protein
LIPGLTLSSAKGEEASSAKAIMGRVEVRNRSEINLNMSEFPFGLTGRYSVEREHLTMKMSSILLHDIRLIKNGKLPEGGRPAPLPLAGSGK